jgi:hypothetical protein
MINEAPIGKSGRAVNKLSYKQLMILLLPLPVGPRNAVVNADTSMQESDIHDNLLMVCEPIDLEKSTVLFSKMWEHIVIYILDEVMDNHFDRNSEMLISMAHRALYAMH